VEQLTGALLNHIIPGLQQARQALAGASMAASDTLPGGTQTLDAEAHDAMPPPPSLPFEYGTPADEASTGGVGATGELDYQNDETQMGEAAPADDASAAADAGDETQEPALPGAKRASDATSNSPPPKRARASLAAADETADEDDDAASSAGELDFS
jgi:hypothetical protein